MAEMQNGADGFSTKKKKGYKISINGVKVTRKTSSGDGSSGSLLRAVIRFARAQWFILAVFVSILLAKLDPSIGVKVHKQNM